MRRIPLLVHIVFHPTSERSRLLALRLHQALNDDAVVPGLRIPTLFCPEDGSATPIDQGLDQAERRMVVTLADDELNADESWCRFVGDLWQTCGTPGHRFIPVQLSQPAWPLDVRLSKVNFLRAHSFEEASRADSVTRRVVIELCRYLHGDDSGGADGPAPTRVFISHTKLDLGVEPRVVERLKEYLTVDQPVKAWFDSGDTPTGSEFSKAIEQGIQDTSLLCALTDRYATREWCRREALLAKEKQRPVVVIDGLNEHEVRSFPYLGNVPVIRWNGRPEAAIDILLKETLRHLHTKLILERSKTATDTIFIRAPELATLVGLPRDATVLYPDPPVGVVEGRLLLKTGISATTPLERIAKGHGLSGKSIALSLSESTDIRRFGLDKPHQESAALELARYLLITQATLAYGGHLGSAGYTEKLFEVVRTHNEREDVRPLGRIVNYTGWPLPQPDAQTRSRYKYAATLKRVGRPDGIDERMHPDFTLNPSFFAGDVSPLHRYAWARGMTAMRESQTRDTCARIVLGGTFGPTEKALPDNRVERKWYFGRIPGLFEEALISAQAGQPVFLIGGFGGVAGLLIDLLEGREREEATWEYQSQAPYAREMRAIYESRGEKWWDYPEMTAFLRDKGIAGLNPLLSADEHRELFLTRDPMRMVEIVLVGLGRMGDKTG